MSDILITSAVLGVAIVLFASDRVRLDLVALCALLALVLAGVLDVPAALAGFSSPATLTIAGLFVVGAGLSETGVADWLGRLVERHAGKGEAPSTAVVMAATACVSAFMSSTGTVAILLPVAGTLARRRGIPPARLFMPLAFAAHLGSNLTLIATPPNVIVSDALRAAGHEPFRFFSFFGPGAVVLALGVAFVVLFARRALARAEGAAERGAARSLSLDDLAAEYGLTSAQRALRVTDGSPLAGKSLAESRLRTEHGVTVVGIRRGAETCYVVPSTVLEAGDELRVLGTDEAVRRMAEALDLSPLAVPAGFPLAEDESLAELVVPRRSSLAGKSLRELRFRDRHRASVLGLRRKDGTLIRDARAMRDVPLAAGDTLLVKGRVRFLRNLRDERADLVLVAEPDAGARPTLDRARAIRAVAITLVMLAVMATGALPNVVAVLAAAAAMALARCVRPVEVYRSVSWESVVLIACMIPFATALESSGAMALVVERLESILRGASPGVVLALLLVATSALGMVLSNTTTAILLAPLAARLAASLGIAPEPLLIGVAFASSAAFATPIASPVNLLVMGPGGYRFSDFVRLGLPLQLLVLAATAIVVPLFWPF